MRHRGPSRHWSTTTVRHTERLHLKIPPRHRKELEALASRHGRGLTEEVMDMIRERADRELVR